MGDLLCGALCAQLIEAVSLHIIDHPSLEKTYSRHSLLVSSGAGNSTLYIRQLHNLIRIKLASSLSIPTGITSPPRMVHFPMENGKGNVKVNIK